MKKLVPPYMKDLLLPFNWNVRQVWELSAPRESVSIEALRFLLENPFWSRNPDSFTDFDLCPIDVLSGRFESIYHRDRIQTADTSFPIDFIEHNQTLWIVDGIHRLAAHYQRGNSSVRIRKHSIAIRPLIEVSP
jgi:hypothetical protein